MTVDEVMERLRGLGDERVRARSVRSGDEPGFGVKMGDLRKVAKEIGTSTPFARELWATGQPEARQIATLVVRPKELGAEEVERMVREATGTWLADWLNSYVVKLHPAREEWREAWSRSDDPMLRRSGWSLTADRVAKGGEDLDLDALLDRIEAEMPGAPPVAQWTMNSALAMVGIHSPAHRARALAIGERLGVLRDYPTPKGCTSPYAPLWIAEMVRRQDGAATA